MTAAFAVARFRLCGRVLAAGPVGWKEVDRADAGNVIEVDGGADVLSGRHRLDFDADQWKVTFYRKKAGANLRKDLKQGRRENAKRCERACFSDVRNTCIRSVVQ